jgi:hypothetical protein
LHRSLAEPAHDLVTLFGTAEADCQDVAIADFAHETKVYSAVCGGAGGLELVTFDDQGKRHVRNSLCLN